MEWKTIDITEMDKSKYAAFASGIGVLLVFVGVITSPDGNPPGWLTAWTAWVIDYVALAVSAGAVVGVSQAAIRKLNKP